jgi:hypothetical protein
MVHHENVGRVIEYFVSFANLVLVTLVSSSPSSRTLHICSSLQFQSMPSTSSWPRSTAIRLFSLLAKEFGVEELTADLSAFQSVRAPCGAEIRERIMVLKESVHAHTREIAAINAKLVPSEAEIARLSTAIESFRAELSPSQVSPAGFASMAIPQYPAFLAEFHRQSFKLLRRDSRDGHANTLTLIRDTEGNFPTFQMFPRFTQNHRIFLREDALKAEKMADAILRHWRCG